MSKELNRMQELAGVPVKKESLNEHQIGGVVGIGAIHTPKREKSDYEMAFEHFMNEGKEEEVEEVMGYDRRGEKTLDPEASNYTKVSEEDDTMEEAVGISATPEAIRGEIQKLINKFEFDEDLGAAVRSKFSSK